MLNSVTILNQRLSCLLFADDIVLFSDNPRDLQESINSLHSFCTTSFLNINIDKTKIIVFGKNPKYVTETWKISDAIIKVTDSYKYLGTWLHWKGSFHLNQTKLAERANKALHLLQHKITQLNITDVNILMKLFNAVIKPILMYNAEIWGVMDAKLLEKICLKFYKFILGVSQRSTNTAIYCELGILPFSFHTKTAVVMYHERLIKQPIPSLLLDAYNLSITLAREGLESWYSLMNKILQSLGLNFNDSSATHAYTSDIITRIQEQHLQKLDLQLHNPTGSSAWGGNKLRYYCRF